MEWPYALNRDGYGRLKSAMGTWAHRAAYILYYGPLLPGLWYICHHCDNPKCFRPSHLFLGTPTDNMQDCKHKGRYRVRPVYGAGNGRSKVTEAQIGEINTMYLSGNFQKKDIAKQFGINASTLRKIATRKLWAHRTDLEWDKP
jgi:hypothetical protein